MPEAVDTLMANCEDAYGFPPYSEIEGFLRRRNGTDLGALERMIVTNALSAVPATLLMSDTMDWWRRLPAVAEGWLAGPESNGRARGASGATTGRNGRPGRGAALRA